MVIRGSSPAGDFDKSRISEAFRRVMTRLYVLAASHSDSMSLLLGALT